MGWFKNNVPDPAAAQPPGVTDMGALGASTTHYARADHTHASKVRKGLIAIGSNVGTYTWVYPNPFAVGVVPVCNGIAQTAPGVTDLVNVQIDGATTNTQCVFRITRYSQSFLSLLGINILGLNTTSLPITLHMVALEP